MTRNAGNGGQTFARTFLAGLLAFIVVMSTICSAVTVDSLTTTPEDSPQLRNAFSDEVVVVEEPNTTRHLSAIVGKVQPQIAEEYDPTGSKGVISDVSTSEIEVLSFSVNQTEDSWFTEEVSISGGNPHLHEFCSYEDKVEFWDWGESVCENLSYSYRWESSQVNWYEVENYDCVSGEYDTELDITFFRMGNDTSDYNYCSILLKYINVTIRYSDGNLSGGYQSEGGGGFGSWSGNTFTASWDKWNSHHFKGNLSVTLSQKPVPKSLVVKIIAPTGDFVARTVENVTISAQVTDDQNNTVTGSSIDSVVASFKTNAKWTSPNLNLYDDGAHDDGSKDDGIYANVWRPDQTGDYTITVSAEKDGYLDGVDTVKGIVIAKPVLEIPAQFKHVRPYKDELGEDAPVFQRGVENPQFKISNLTGAQPSGVKLVIEILTVESGVGSSSVKNITVRDSWSASPLLVEWDWSNNAGQRPPSEIPVGFYGATAKLVNSSTNTTLEESDSKDFYVIFNYPQGERYYVTNHNSFLVHLDDNRSFAYRLHQYNATIWRNALITVSGSTKVSDASRKLRVSAYDLGGRGHNYPPNPSKQNCWWFNTLTFLDERIGVCVDYAALMTAYCRAAGIPARTLTGHAMEHNNPNHDSLWGHMWVEIFDGPWYWYDPTNEQPPGGTYGTDRYATQGVEFRPLPKYYVAAPGPGGEEPDFTSNVYDRYTFCADVVNFTFTNAPPGGYDYGQTVQCNVTVANLGTITISQPLNVSIYEAGGLSLPSQFPHRLTRVDKIVADTLDSGRLASASFFWTLPDFGRDSSFYERVYERYENVVVYYRDVQGRKIETDSYKKRIPGLCISPLPIITVDGERRELSNATFSSMNHTDEMSLKTETFVLDVPAVVTTRTEHEVAENYSKAVVSLDNPDTDSHSYSFSLQLAGRGDALYLPALGSITSNCTGLNVSTNYLLSYDQANGTDDYISIHEFSQNATIEDLEFIEYKGVRGMLINVTWNRSLDRYSSQDFAIYFSRRLGGGLNMPVIHTALAEEIVANGDSLSTLRIATPDSCRVGDTLPINVTIFNNGVASETITVALNVTKVIGIVPYTVIGLYNDTALTTVPPQTEKNVTFVVAIPELTTSGVWDIKAETAIEIEATSVFDVEDAFDLAGTHIITVPQYSPFTFNATVTNTWDTAVHDVTVTLDFFYGIHTPDPKEKQLGTLLPGESRTVSWHLNATAPGELPFDVGVTSSDGGSDTMRSAITSLAPPELWIPNVIIRTTNPDSGTAKTAFVNATIYNVGDVLAPNVQLQLILPENVTSTVLNRDIGDLFGGEEKNVSLDITFDTQSDFSFAVIATDNANHSVTGTVMVSLIGPALPDLTLTSEDIQFTLPSSGYTSSVGQRTLFQPFYNAEIASDALKLEIEERDNPNVKFMSSAETINSSWTLSPPTIDGTLAAGEWTGAVKMNITYHADDNCSMLVMNDEENLYIAFDVVSDTTNDLNTQDVVQLGFDGDYDDLIAPYDTDPFYAGGTGVDLWAKLRGNSTESRAGWLTMNEAGTECSRWYYLNNPTGPQVLATDFSGHRTYEYRVPLATALNRSTGDIVGFNALINDGLGTLDTGDFRTQGLWPSTWNGLCDFSADGDLVLATAPTAELAAVKATIHNIGWADAGDIVVQFFEGDPDSGGIQMGEDQIILSIAAEGTGSAEVCWDITEEVGSHVIYVRIDANNTEAELNEANNLAFKHIGVPGVRCADPNVTIDRAKTSMTDDPVGDGYDLSDAPANVKILNAKGFIINATGPNGTHPFNITFLSSVIEGFVLFKLPEWTEIPYTILDAYTIQVQLDISNGVLDPAFVLASVATFDTRSGTYPSISGEHNGTITPNQTLSVSTLYTYPCPGTGGHTEYVRIYNLSGTIAEASWSGYVGDWRTISFPGTFILRANETYNYTIKTGSYPQIIHAESKDVTGGRISCEQFVDVNGKRYNNWIPAIRLS